jgi:hypothetical protein
MKIGSFEVDINRVTKVTFDEERQDVSIVTFDGANTQEFTRPQGERIEEARKALHAPAQSPAPAPPPAE